MLFLIPTVIVWSPLEQYPHLSPACPKCEVDHAGPSTLVAFDWTDGHSQQCYPRALHDVSSSALLISRLYKCSVGHVVYGHHPSLLNRLQQMNLQCLVPFKLWHRTGFTQAFMEYVEQALHTGISLQQLESGLLSNRVHRFYSIKRKFEQLIQHQPYTGQSQQIFPHFDDASVTLWKDSPTRHSIAACYLLHFWENESAYTQCMRMTTLASSSGSAWLSCDHTFRSVANIGVVRKSDRSWIKQYSGLFCVLNQDGEVMTWKLTRSVSFEHTQQQLSQLCQRLHEQGNTVDEFYVDICCSWRNKLQAIFGPQLRVCLDIFHAVQRITKAIPKRHPYHKHCLQSLTFVFRDPSDQGLNRNKPTPPPHILRENMRKFQTQWEGVSFNGREILPPAAIKEIRCLMKHIDKGCLSGIQPGRGTNRNERLHRQLNAIIGNSRYGVEFAYAQFTSTFYCHNEAIAAKRDKRTARPITAYCGTGSGQEPIGGQERFGLLNAVLQDDTSVSDTATEPATEVKIPMSQLDYKTVKEKLEILESTIHSQDEVESEDEVEFSPAEALSILQHAICSFYVSSSFKGMSDTAYINSKDVFFFSFIAMIEGLPTANTPSDALQQLESVLRSWNFRRVPVTGDGNCLFTAIALALIQRIRGTDTMLIQRLSTMGLPMERMHDVNSIAKWLRTCMVKEWMDNTDYYQGFVSADVTAVAHQYLTSGHFTGDLGDLMVLTLANVLHMPITVFTSVVNMPVLCIIPTVEVADSVHPIFITFTQAGPGHYDYAIPVEQLGVDSTHTHVHKPKVTKCTCGRSVGFTGKACSTYRCPCTRAKQQCTHLCRCKHCTNKHGCRPPPSTSRRRASYDTQRQPLCGVPADLFMQKVGETSLQGHLTLLEVMVLKAIIMHFIVHGFAITIDNLITAYKQTVQVAHLAELVEFPLSNLVQEKIEQFLKKLHAALELLRSVFLS